MVLLLGIDVIQPLRGLLKNTHRAVMFGQVKSVPFLGIECHAVPTFLRLRERQYVRNTCRVVPYSSVPTELADQLSTGNSSVAVNVHRVRMFANIRQQFFVAKHIDCRLVIKKDPVSRKLAVVLDLHDNPVVRPVSAHVNEGIVVDLILVVKEVDVIHSTRE